MASVITAGTASNTALNLTGDTSGELQLRTNNGSTTAMTLTTGGNVGIGNTAPQYPLDITSNSGANALGIRGRVSGDIATVRFTSNDGVTNYGSIQSRPTQIEYATSTTIPLIFSTNSAERMRIDSSGNVGIGVTPSAWNSSVKAIQLNNTASVWAFTGQSRIGNNLFYDAGGAFRYLTTNPASDFSQTTNGFTWSWATSGSAGSVATLNPILVLNANGALVLSGGDQGATGVGITFPATQSPAGNANTLDDYEEGTWTPNLGGNTTYNFREGNYTKVGRVVTITWDVFVNTIGTGSTFVLTGLPFTAATGPANSGSGVTNGGGVGWFTGLASSVLGLFPRVDGNTASLVISGTVGSTNAINNNSIFGNSARVSGCLTYFTST